MTYQKTYHERVAAVMKASYSAGSLNSYGAILDALHAKFPTEQSLREWVEIMQRRARIEGNAPENWTLLGDGDVEA